MTGADSGRVIGRHPVADVCDVDGVESVGPTTGRAADSSPASSRPPFGWKAVYSGLLWLLGVCFFYSLTAGHLIPGGVFLVLWLAAMAAPRFNRR